MIVQHQVAFNSMRLVLVDLKDSLDLRRLLLNQKNIVVLAEYFQFYEISACGTQRFLRFEEATDCCSNQRNIVVLFLLCNLSFKACIVCC